MQIIHYIDDTDACKLWQFLCQSCSLQLVYSADAMWWYEAICAFWEGKTESSRRTHAVCKITPHRKFYNYCISYLIKKYELYLTFSIIIILHAPDRVWDGAAACPAKSLTEDSLRSVNENSGPKKKKVLSSHRKNRVPQGPPWTAGPHAIAWVVWCLNTLLAIRKPSATFGTVYGLNRESTHIYGLLVT